MNFQTANFSMHYQVVSLSAAREADVEGIFAICRENLDYFKHMKSQPSAEHIRQDLTALPSGKSIEDKCFVGFYQESQMIAFIDLIADYPCAGTVFIGWFMVRKSEQGRGVGSEIVSAVLAAFKKAGFASARLGFVKGNRQSERFWRKNGFLPNGIETHFDDYDIVLMQREL